MKRSSILIALGGVAIGLTGCANMSPPDSSMPSVATGPMPNSYAYPSSFGNSFSQYGYHPLPYDNTGNGPSETGMEGGGG